MFKRNRLLLAHLSLAAFFLPMMVIYLSSGLLYSLGLFGHLEKQTIVVKLEEPFVPNIDLLEQVTRTALAAHDLKSPKGEPVLKKSKESYTFLWSDLRFSVSAKIFPQEKIVRLNFRKRNFLAQLMRIHRADAGWGFKALSLSLVLGLGLVYASGLYMAVTLPKHKPLMLKSLFLGTMVVALLFLL